MDSILNIPEVLLWALIGILALLIAGTLTSWILPRYNPEKWSDLRPRMRSWWVMCGCLIAAMILGEKALIVFFAFISYLALKEYMTLAPTRKQDRGVVLFSYLIIIPTYALVWFGQYSLFLIFIPVYGFLSTAVMMAFTRRTDGFLTTIGIMQFGVLSCVYTLAYVPFLMKVPHSELPEAGAVGLVFFLLFLTQLNDIAQYMWGKFFGKHKISPNISPNKTWEGALGGLFTTLTAFYFLSPYFVDLDLFATIFIGLTLPVIGFFGDITMSAIKRDLGVKDSSRLIPGHGGVLDRVDSLIFTAPWYFHMLAFFAFTRF